jgi:DHA2 family methylenomycin A resistance protein-like MFS transporter
VSHPVAPTAPAPTDRAVSSVSRPRVVLLLSSLGFFLITLDISIVNVALPSIDRELGGGTTTQQWVIDGYTLMFASLLLFAGNLSERIGARRALAYGTAGFLLASVACALAPTSGTLVAARFVQGVAAAAMLPTTMALIRETFPDPRERAKALGVWAVGGAVASAVGPLVGGALTTIDWRLVFGINLRQPTPFDWAGQVLAVVALSALVYGLIHGGSAGFGEPSVVIPLAVAVVGIAAFLLVQARGRHPMMPLELFRSSGIRIALAVGFAFMAGMFGATFLISLFLQQQLGLSPLQAGLVFLPAAVFSVVGNLASGPLTNRFGPRGPAVAGQLSMVTGLVALLLAAPIGSPVLVAGLLALIGPGGSIAMPAVTSVVLDSVPAERAGTASAVFNTFRQVGGAVAIAIFGGLLASAGSFVGGLQISFTIAAALLLLTALLSLRVRAHPPAAHG